MIRVVVRSTKQGPHTRQWKAVAHRGDGFGRRGEGSAVIMVVLKTIKWGPHMWQWKVEHRTPMQRCKVVREDVRLPTHRTSWGPCAG
jgi:hypothetical protein